MAEEAGDDNLGDVGSVGAPAAHAHHSEGGRISRAKSQQEVRVRCVDRERERSFLLTWVLLLYQEKGEEEEFL